MTGAVEKDNTLQFSQIKLYFAHRLMYNLYCIKENYLQGTLQTVHYTPYTTHLHIKHFIYIPSSQVNSRLQQLGMLQFPLLGLQYKPIYNEPCSIHIFFIAAYSKAASLCQDNKLNSTRVNRHQLKNLINEQKKLSNKSYVLQQFCGKPPKDLSRIY